MFKKAMSPIFATVLLIAFAVSLGAVILNIGVGATLSTCADISVDVFVIGNTPRVCYSVANQEIQFTLTNRKEPVDGFKVSAIGVSVDEVELRSRVETLSNFVGVLPVSHPQNKAAMTITPFRNDGGRLTYCADKMITIENIPNC